MIGLRHGERNGKEKSERKKGKRTFSCYLIVVTIIGRVISKVRKKFSRKWNIKFIEKKTRGNFLKCKTGYGNRIRVDEVKMKTSIVRKLIIYE